MGRRARVLIDNSTYLIYQKSIKSLKAFRDREDLNIFLQFLKEISSRYTIEINSFSIAENSFTLLITSSRGENIPKFMQLLGRKYVRYYNSRYHRKGTIWEGRYKLSLVQDRFLFDAMEFIESLDSLISSKESTTLGRGDGIVTFHKVYKDLGFTPNQRALNYQNIAVELSNKRREFIKNSLDRQNIIGDIEFIEELESKLNIPLKKRKRGRPKKINQEGEKMYKSLVVLDKDKHSDLKIKPMNDLNFAKGLAFIPLLANEVEEVSKLFPVVFTNDEEPSIVAIVSLGSGNLAINEEGKWIGAYVPAFLRKYPFALVSNKEDKNQKIVLIDEESELLSKKEGEALFNEKGEPTEALNHAIEFLRGYSKEDELTKGVAKALHNSGILEEREITAGKGEEKKVLVKGFRVVNRDKLNNLSDDILADWTRKGVITLIDNHLRSLNNTQKLFALAVKKQNL